MRDIKQIASEYSDTFKEAYGFRPRDVDTSNWTVANFHSEIDRLIEVIAVKDGPAIHNFEMRVQSLIAGGAHDRAMAIRWIHEAEGSNGDHDYLCWALDLPANYLLPVRLAA